MSLIVRIEHLQPGWFFAEDILNRSGGKLVVRGSRVSERIIGALRARGIKQIKVCLMEEDLEAGGGMSLSEKDVSRTKGEIRRVFTEVARQRGLAERSSRLLREAISPIVNSIFRSSTFLVGELRSMAGYDEYTFEHSWMVMILSLALARVAFDRGMLRGDQRNWINMGVGSALHDIGKLVVPVKVLRKPGKLDDREWKAIRYHPHYGWKIVRQDVNIMPMARAIVLHHHQRWDGRGYGAVNSRKLAGSAIPPLVRLVSIADAYDAIVSDRPYHRGVLPFRAEEIIEENGGSQFDPDYVFLLRNVVVKYPPGSILFLRDGLLTAVCDSGEKNGEVLCRVISSFSEEKAAAVGRKIGIRLEREEIVEAAPTIDSVADVLRKKGDGLPRKTMSEWRPLLEKVGLSERKG